MMYTRARGSLRAVTGASTSRTPMPPAAAAKGAGLGAAVDALAGAATTAKAAKAAKAHRVSRMTRCGAAARWTDRAARTSLHH